MDEAILLWVNGNNTEWLDAFMTIFTHRFAWIPLYIAIAYAILRTLGWQRGMLYIIAVALTVVIADQVGGALIRPAVARLRPSNIDNPLSAMLHIVDGYRGGRYGMPSCHAANTAGLLTIIMLRFNNRTGIAILALWMLGQCYSRMYLGVHYPTDLLAGMALGAASGALSFCAYRYAHCKIFKEGVTRSQLSHTSVPAAVLLLSLLVMAVAAS